MRRAHELIKARGGEVLVVSFAPVDRLQAFQTYLQLPFPVAADDPSRSAYRAYGLLIGQRSDIWHPRTMLRYLVLVFRDGMKLQRSGERDDLDQLGGDFVIGPEGRLRYAYRSRRPDDRPPVEALLDAL